MTSQAASQQKNKRSIKSFFPIIDWLPNYQGKWLRGDVIAALTFWALLVPEAMALMQSISLALTTTPQ